MVLNLAAEAGSSSGESRYIWVPIAVAAFSAVVSIRVARLTAKSADDRTKRELNSASQRAQRAAVQEFIELVSKSSDERNSKIHKIVEEYDDENRYKAAKSDDYEEWFRARNVEVGNSLLVLLTELAVYARRRVNILAVEVEDKDVIEAASRIVDILDLTIDKVQNKFESNCADIDGYKEYRIPEDDFREILDLCLISIDEELDVLAKDANRKLIDKYDARSVSGLKWGKKIRRCEERARHSRLSSEASRKIRQRYCLLDTRKQDEIRAIFNDKFAYELRNIDKSPAEIEAQMTYAKIVASLEDLEPKDIRMLRLDLDRLYKQPFQ